MSKTQKRPVCLSELPTEHKYLYTLIGDAVWLIMSKIDNEEVTPETVIPREILLKISIAPRTNRLPVVVSESISFGKPYGEVESEYANDEWEMGMPSWYHEPIDEEQI